MAARRVESSRWPIDHGTLDVLDKRLSAAIFNLQLGVVLESLLSVPGCFFGMPAFHVVAPALLACSVDRTGCRAAQPWAMFAVLSATMSLFCAWGLIQRSSEALRHARLLYLPPTMLASPPIGVSLARALTTDDAALAACYYFLLAWYASVLPVLTLKAVARRRRPVACDGISRAAEGKALPNIPAMLRSGDPNAAFPSGDVAGAVAFAYPLWHCAGAPSLAVACVALSALGRMYWLAHHLLDVACGAAISLLTCVALDVALGAAAGGTLTQLWHPILAFVVVIAYVKLTGVADAAPVKPR